jgi:hypothetical protein
MASTHSNQAELEVVQGPAWFLLVRQSARWRTFTMSGIANLWMHLVAIGVLVVVIIFLLGSIRMAKEYRAIIRISMYPMLKSSDVPHILGAEYPLWRAMTQPSGPERRATIKR